MYLFNQTITTITITTSTITSSSLVHVMLDT
jgi:hypothetical protein